MLNGVGELERWVSWMRWVPSVHRSSPYLGALAPHALLFGCIGLLGLLWPWIFPAVVLSYFLLLRICLGSFVALSRYGSRCESCWLGSERRTVKITDQPSRPSILVNRDYDGYVECTWMRDWSALLRLVARRLVVCGCHAVLCKCGNVACAIVSNWSLA